jgi:chitodextrinase
VAQGPSAALPFPIQHVVVVFLENEEATSALTAPFEAHLADRYAIATNDYAICHPSAPNYLAATSGATWQCGSDNLGAYNTTSIGSVLTAANRSWGEFAEDMPTPCDRNDAYPYMTKHNPFVFYDDVIDNATYCDAHVQSFTAFDADVANGTVPNYSFITPNMLDDGHDTTLEYADHWLAGWLSPLLNDSFFQSSVFFITYDEGATDAGYNGTDGGNIYLAAVSPFVQAGSTFTPYVSQFNLLSTVEWLLGVGGTGHNDSTPAWPAMKGLFDFGPALAVAADANVTAGVAPLSVGFQANVSGGTAPYTYAWEFGDGNTSSSPNPSHVFTRAGTYNVTLAVTDQSNRTANAMVTVRTTAPRPQPLNVTVSAARLLGPVLVPFGFRANVTGGRAPYSVSWEFGDGGTAVGTNVSHPYDGAGPFEISATAADSRGSLAVAYVTVDVYAALQVGVTLQPRDLRLGGTIQASAETIGGPGPPLDYSWSVNGQAIGTANAFNVSYTPAQAGPCTFRVNVTDIEGDAAVAEATANVTSPVVVLPPSTPAAGPEVLGLPTAEGYGLLIGLVAVVAAAAFLAFRYTRNGRRPRR